MRALNLSLLPILIVGLFVPSISFAAPGILDNIALSYKNASQSWYATLFGYAHILFAQLATIEFCYAGITWMLHRHELDSLMAALIKKIMSIGFFYAILLYADQWIPAIIDSFLLAGQSAAGVTELSPSQVFDSGLKTAGILIKTYGLKGLMTHPISGLLAIALSIIIVFCFAVITGQFIITLIESYIAISAGVLFLGFGGSRWTVDFTQKQLAYAFATGVKLFIVYLIIGIGQTQAVLWGNLLQTTDLASGDGVVLLLSVMGSSLVYMLLAWNIPSLAAAKLSGSPTLTAGAAALTMATTATAGIAAGALVGSKAIAAVKGGTALAKAAGAAWDTAGADRHTQGLSKNPVAQLGNAAKHFGSAFAKTMPKSDTKGGRMKDFLNTATQNLNEQTEATKPNHPEANSAITPLSTTASNAISADQSKASPTNVDHASPASNPSSSPETISSIPPVSSPASEMTMASSGSTSTANHTVSAPNSTAEPPTANTAHINSTSSNTQPENVAASMNATPSSVASTNPVSNSHIDGSHSANTNTIAPAESPASHSSIQQVPTQTSAASTPPSHPIKSTSTSSAPAAPINVLSDNVRQKLSPNTPRSSNPTLEEKLRALSKNSRNLPIPNDSAQSHAIHIKLNHIEE